MPTVFSLEPRSEPTRASNHCHDENRLTARSSDGSRLNIGLVVLVHIQIKLMGMLKEKTPRGGALALADGATIQDVLRELDIPTESVQIFTLNGSLVKDQKRGLDDGDELTILPPVGGG